MKENDKIFIAGSTGLIGSSIVRKLKEYGYFNLITKTSKELDLTIQQNIISFFEKERPDYVFLVAGKSKGIIGNVKYPVEILYQNLLIECNVINSAFMTKVKKLLFLACGCVYPKESPQPMKEEYLFSGKPEKTNIAQATAKLTGIVLCESYNKQYNCNFISCVSANVFGPNDSFDLESGHVIPALINKFHSAKMKNEPTVVIWGTGSPIRDFIYVDDLADALIFLMKNYNSSEPINISANLIVSIAELANLIKEIVGYKGDIVFDPTKPDGVPKKILDSTRITALGWRPKVSLKEGLEKTYQWFVKNKLG